MKSWFAILIIGLTIAGLIILKTQQMERLILLRGSGDIRNAAYGGSGDTGVEPLPEYETPKSSEIPIWSVSPATDYVRSL